MSSKISRRRFLETGALAAAGLTVVPSSVLGKSMGYKAPSDKLNIVGVGVGGMGNANLTKLQSENIIGLCDGTGNIARTYSKVPKREKYYDYRKCTKSWVKQWTRSGGYFRPHTRHHCRRRDDDGQARMFKSRLLTACMNPVC